MSLVAKVHDENPPQRLCIHHSGVFWSFKDILHVVGGSYWERGWSCLFWSNYYVYIAINDGC